MQPTEITANVWIFTSSLYQTTSTVIRTQHHVIIADPNWLPAEVYGIRDFVRQISEGRKHILLFTHSDYDHIIGYGAFPEAKVIASQAFIENDRKERDLEQARQFDLERGLKRDYPLTYPRVDIPVLDHGQKLELDEATLTFYLAKGHTEQGVFTIIEPHGIWIAGDYLSDVEFPLVEDIDAYRKTLNLAGELPATHQIRYLVPGHGSIAASEATILRRRDEALGYLEDLGRVLRGEAFPEEKYRNRYPTWESLSDWHKGNIESLRAGTQPL